MTMTAEFEILLFPGDFSKGVWQGLILILKHHFVGQFKVSVLSVMLKEEGFSKGNPPFAG